MLSKALKFGGKVWSLDWFMLSKSVHKQSWSISKLLYTTMSTFSNSERSSLKNRGKQGPLPLDTPGVLVDGTRTQSVQYCKSSPMLTGYWLRWVIFVYNEFAWWNNNKWCWNHTSSPCVWSRMPHRLAAAGRPRRETRVSLLLRTWLGPLRVNK